MRSLSLAWRIAAVAVASLVSLAVPQVTSAAPVPAKPTIAPMPAKPTTPTLPAGQQYACAAAKAPGQMACMAIVRTMRQRSALPATALPAGYGPGELRSAYKIARAAARGGRGATIAVVDAFGDPKAAADLATYRAKFRLAPCTLASKCLRIVNQGGKASPLPAANWDWAGEESLDLDMVSAICPNCHILLVEARSAGVADLGTAVNTAVKLGAKYVSNSWSGTEFGGQSSYNHFFDHPGVAIAVASGDYGYGTLYPADLQYVTSVGGTSLTHARNARGWIESVWGSAAAGAEGTGSGCSTFEAKPSWQRADAPPNKTAQDGCLNRTENDVAAVADPNTGVAMYDTYASPLWPKGWNEFGGTSASTPIITAMYALAGTPASSSYPGQYPYLHGRQFFNVPTGVNGTCPAAKSYLCHGGHGYNGPTGLGTPDGTGAFVAPKHLVTVVDPGSQKRAAGSKFALRIIGLDARHSSAPLTYRAAGLPAGLSISPVPHTSNAQITGTLRATAGSTFHVTVTATDGTTSGSTRFTIVAA